MKKLYNNRFIFIVSISVIFTMILAIGSMMLVKKQETTFAGAGYIISSNKVISFKNETPYRINLNERVVFSSDTGDIYEISQDTFLHYSDNSIATLKNAAFVDLNGLGSSIVPYYNITKKSIIRYNDGGYTIKNGEEELYFDDILVRINEEKFIVAGKNISAKIAGVDGLLRADYFEITFIENGIVLIENDKDTYQVTAEDTVIYAGNTVIDLGTKNIMYGSEIRLNMTELTIDGNENITIVPEENPVIDNGNGGGAGEGENTESNNVESSTESREESSEESSIESTESSEESIESSVESIESSEESIEESQEESTEPEPIDDEVSVELVKLMVTTKSVTANMQVQNPLFLRGELNVKIINPKTGKEVPFIEKPVVGVNGVLNIYNDKLDANTNYMLEVSETKNDGTVVQYLQRMFATSAFGINLRKIMISDSAADYEVLFEEETPAESVVVTLYEGTDQVENSTMTVTKDSPTFGFTNLNSNTTYTIKVIGYSVGAVTEINQNGYVTRSFKTLKRKPSIGSISVDNVGDKSFDLRINDIDDPDGAIINYTYYIYNTEDVTLDSMGQEVSKIEYDKSNLIVSIGEYNIKDNENYVFKSIIEYNDNERIREIETEISNSFKLSLAMLSFEQKEEMSSFDTIGGIITLKDPDCTVPMSGRPLCNENNEFFVNGMGLNEPVEVFFTATDDPNIFVSELSISGLVANTTYNLNLFGNTKNRYNETIYRNMIGDQFSATTQAVDKLRVEKVRDNVSNYETPITVTVKMDSSSNNEKFIDAIGSAKVGLYSVISGNKELIKEITIGHDELVNLYRKNYTITNKFFGIENMDELLEVAVDNSMWSYRTFTIEFRDAKDINDINNIEIDPYIIETEINRSFLVEYYSNKKKLDGLVDKLVVTPILNTDRLLDENLESDIVMGYRLSANTVIDDVLKQYYGTVGDNVNCSYVYYIYDINGDIIYTKYSTLAEYDFYLDKDIENFGRGNAYSFGLQIVLDEGVETLYPSEPIITLDNGELFAPKKQDASIVMAAWKSTNDEMTFIYKVNDADNALYSDNLYIENSANGSVVPVSISKSEEYNYVTVSGLTAGTNYKVNYHKIDNTLVDGYSVKNNGSFTFKGEFTLVDDTFDLTYESVGNTLAISINDLDLVNRADLITVTLKSATLEKEFIFTRSDFVFINSGDPVNSLEIRYSSITEFQGTDVKVSVNVYYENGLIGLNQSSTSGYHVFKNTEDGSYLNVSKSGNVSTRNVPTGIYEYAFDVNNMEASLKNTILNGAWNDNMTAAKLKILLDKNGAHAGNYDGFYNAEAIEKKTLSTSNDNFFFSAIIPMVSSSAKTTINSSEVTLNISGLTPTIVENEFESTNKKIYIDLYADEEKANKLATFEGVIPDNFSNGVFKLIIDDINGLIPDTTYYYDVYAYILSKESGVSEYVKTLLFDQTSGREYISTIKSFKTLGASEILNKVDAYYETTSTNEEYSIRKLYLDTNLKDINNYKLTYKITDSIGDIIFTYNEDNITNAMEIVETLDDNFVFGDAGYNMVITAITDDENAYQLVLYDGEFKPHLKGNNNVSELRDVVFSINNASVYIPNGQNRYAIKFSVGIKDDDKVLTNGEYYVKLSDRFGNVYESNEYPKNSDGYAKLTTINKTLIYEGLDPETQYTIEVKGSAYMNNVSYENKNMGFVLSTPIRTGIKYNLNLGTASLGVSDNILTITYTGAYGLENIESIEMTIFNGNNYENLTLTKNVNLNISHEGNVYKLIIDKRGSAISYNSTDRVLITADVYASDLDGNIGKFGYFEYANYTE